MPADNEIAARLVVRSALSHFALDDADLHFVKYRENYVFRAELGTEAYAVRLHRFGLRTASEVATELDYLVALHARGFSVPEPVTTSSGELVCHIEGEGGIDLLVDVQKWVDGAVPLGDIGEAFGGTSTLDPDEFYRLGQMAADLHNHMTTLGHLPGFSRAAWDCDGLLGPRALWGDPLRLAALTTRERDILETAIETLTERLGRLGRTPDVYGVVHADFTPENILVRGDERVLIDFDDFGQGWFLFELATILFFYRPHPRYEEYLHAVVAGYRSRRALSESESELLTGMILARGLTYLGWSADRRRDDTAEFIAEHVRPVVVGIAEEFLSER